MVAGASGASGVAVLPRVGAAVLARQRRWLPTRALSPGGRGGPGQPGPVIVVCGGPGQPGPVIVVCGGPGQPGPVIVVCSYPLYPALRLWRTQRERNARSGLAGFVIVETYPPFSAGSNPQSADRPARGVAGSAHRRQRDVRQSQSRVVSARDHGRQRARPGGGPGGSWT